MFLSWRTLKELLPLLFEAILHLLEDPPPGKQASEQQAVRKAQLIAKLYSYEDEILGKEKDDADEA